MPTAADKLLTVKQVAELLGVSEDTIYRRVADGGLAAVHVGQVGSKRRTLRFRHAYVAAFLRKRAM